MDVVVRTFASSAMCVQVSIAVCLKALYSCIEDSQDTIQEGRKISPSGGYWVLPLAWLI